MVASWISRFGKSWIIDAKIARLPHRNKLFKVLFGRVLIKQNLSLEDLFLNALAVNLMILSPFGFSANFGLHLRKRAPCQERKSRGKVSARNTKLVWLKSPLTRTKQISITFFSNIFINMSEANHPKTLRASLMFMNILEKNVIEILMLRVYGYLRLWQFVFLIVRGWCVLRLWHGAF